jgi:D-alanyl-D-alanine carboxypeptidase/D-alanyl-D-alanine-endopeptidase (penicillin-binding protein 4)
LIFADSMAGFVLKSTAMKSYIRKDTVLVVFTFALLLTGCAPRPAVRVATPAAESGAVERLHSDLVRIFSDPNFASAQWGVEVVSLDRGDVLFEHNSTRLYMPASNNKLVTTSAALVRLGPDYRYETRISADGDVIDGVLRGNLVVAGAGDPSLAPRFHEGDPFRVFKEWAANLKEKGIRKIEGGILGDARAFPPPFIGSSWEWDDLVYGYAAPVSALQFNENLYSVEITPGDAEGAPAKINCSPLPDYVTIDAKVTTIAAGARGKIDFQRGPRRESLVIRGTIAARAQPDTTTLAVELPTLYYLAALKKTLQDEGIAVTSGTLLAIEDIDAQPSAGQLLWSHSSPPLSEILKPLLKVSQNLYAETLARTLGLVLRNQGVFEAGREVVRETLERMAIQRDTYAYTDGSGLSRQNLVSADMLIRIFKYMSRQKYFPVFYDALPIAGVDGTLRGRMRSTKAENNVHGKTGTIAYVRCLSGYVKTADGEMLAFAMIANNFLASNQAAEYVQDSALERLAGFRRKE